MKRKRIIAAAVMLCAGVCFIGGCAKAEITDRYEGSHWFEEVQAPSFETPLLEERDTDSTADTWVYGYQYAPGAMVAADDDYYYIVNYADNRRIYKISKTDYSDSTALTECSGDQINIVGDKIIFAIDDDGSEQEGIYCVDKDGENLTLLSDIVPVGLQVVNDWAYFADVNDRGIYKLNLKTRELVRIFEERCNSLVVSGNDIYFCVFYQKDNADKTANETVNYIGKMDVNGNNIQKSEEKSTDGYLRIFGNPSVLYCTDNAYGIKIMDPQTLLGTNIVIQGYVHDEQAVEDTVWFIASENECKIAIYKLATGTGVFSNISEVYKFVVFDSKIMIVHNMDVTPKVSVHDIETGEVIDFFGIR